MQLFCEAIVSVQLTEVDEPFAGRMLVANSNV